MKRVFKYVLILVIMLSLTLLVRADLNDYSGGTTGYLGTLTGGEWSTHSVGIKVSIVNSSNEVEDSQIFLNSNGANFSTSGFFASSSNKPKTHQTSDIKWVPSANVTTHTATFLPNNWESNGNVINIYNILADNNYQNLKGVLQHDSLKSSVGSGDYIVVEPMTKIKGYYGTAYELSNAFSLNENCSTKGSFCWTYQGQIFGGNSNSYKNGGIFYNTLYLSNDVSALGLTIYTDSGSDYSSRRACFMSKTCGRGIGVFKYNDIYPGGTLKINKYKGNTGNLITSSAATFKVYSGSGCKGTAVDQGSTSGGAVTFTLSPGEYSVEESKSPAGYVVPTNKCVINSVTISSGSNITKDIINTPTCTTKLNDLGNNPTVEQLINLYNEYPTNNNLLNFSNPSCSNKTCNSTSGLNSNDSIITNCLEANGESSSFSESNLSCFDEKFSNSQGKFIGFCKTTLDLNNNLGVNKFYGLSGRFLIEKINNIYRIYDNKLNPIDVSSQYIASAIVDKNCYVLNGETTTINYALPTLQVYFGDKDDDLNADKVDVPLTETSIGSFKKYNISSKYDYKLNSVYLEKLTGKVLKEKTNNTTDAIEAIATNFNATGGNIYFNILYNTKKPINASENKCTYETTLKIVKNDSLDLELRFIDTKKPFNRKTNSNWCDESDCSKDNNVVKENIINRVNSYGLNKDGVKVEPMYKITLNPASIRIIRKYNEDNKYDYYKLIRDSNDNVVSAFVYDLKNGILNQYNEDGTVNFSYGSLSYKLEGTKVQ